VIIWWKWRWGKVLSENNLTVPKATSGDALHATVRAGLSAIPFAGGAAVELFQAVVQPPIEKRRQKWMSEVGDRLLELEAKGLKLEDLQNNEQFISVVMHASQAVIRTHQEAKLKALRNAVINVAIGQAPDETLQHLLLNFVDSFTEQHLRILKLFQNPKPPPNISMGGLSTVLEHNIPELRQHRELYIQLWKDLYSRGLVNTEGLNATMSGNGLEAKRTTELGDSLLRFIE